MLMLTYSDHHRLELGAFNIWVIFDELLYRYQQNPANVFFWPSTWVCNMSQDFSHFQDKQIQFFLTLAYNLPKCIFELLNAIGRGRGFTNRIRAEQQV